MNTGLIQSAGVTGSPIPFFFEGVQLKEACWIGNEPYLTRQAIGEFLEYSDPKKAIDKIIERNPYIDDDRFSTTVKLTVVEGGRNVTRYTRIYNPIGLQLIIFESGQPKAKLCKIAIAHLVYTYMRGELKAPAPGSYLERIQRYLMAPHGTKGDKMREICEVTGKGENTIYKHIKRIRNGLPIRKPRFDKGTRKSDPREVAKVIELRKSGLKIRQIAEQTTLSLGTVCRICCGKIYPSNPAQVNENPARKHRTYNA